MTQCAQLPERIARIVEGKPYRTDGIGLSGSQVRIYDDCVLKIAADSAEEDNAAFVMRWLEGKFPAPRVLEHVTRDGKSFLLMTRVSGEMACDARWMRRPAELMDLLAGALHALWRLDVSDCPATSDLDSKLRVANEAVERGDVDVQNVEPKTYGPGGFRDSEHLLRWLTDNRPNEQPVFSHGDFCLPNVFLGSGNVAGLIDWGRAGVCDRWQDIALCWRSLKSNAAGEYGGPTYPDVHADDLFSALGIAKDEEKLRYYLLLDELF